MKSNLELRHQFSPSVFDSSNPQEDDMQSSGSNVQETRNLPSITPFTIMDLLKDHDVNKKKNKIHINKPKSINNNSKGNKKNNRNNTIKKDDNANSNNPNFNYINLSQHTHHYKHTSSHSGPQTSTHLGVNTASKNTKTTATKAYDNYRNATTSSLEPNSFPNLTNLPYFELTMNLYNPFNLPHNLLYISHCNLPNHFNSQETSRCDFYI